MPRSLQHGDLSASTTTSMTAATSPWNQAASARRPTAQSFSAGDFRNQHEHMVAFEAQLDALVGGAEATGQQQSASHLHMYQHHSQQWSSDMSLVVRGTIERTVSTSSSVGISAGSQGDARAKITGRRHRTPRRFVVTDIPDFDEFNSATPAPSGQTVEDAKRASTAPPRPGRTEVKGRFTIIDLSPDSPMNSPRAQRVHAPVSEPLPKSQLPRPAPSPRRRVIRKSPSQNSVRLEAPTTLSNGAQQVMYLDPVDSAAKARRVDLSVFDRHLDYLQKESAGMKSLLDGMVSTNSRWISALSQAGVTFPNYQATGTPLRPSTPRAVAVVEPEPAPAVRGVSTDEKLAAMERAYMELQKKHDALAGQNKALQEQNALLETRLQQQTQVSDDLRAQLQHLSQYADNTVSDSDPLNEDASSERLSMFGDQSSLDVDDSAPSGAELGDHASEEDYPYELWKAPAYQRRRWDSEEEECMSDTSSEGSMPKSRTRLVDDEDNNNNNNCARSEAPSLVLQSDDFADSKSRRLTANRVEPHMFSDVADTPAATALDTMMQAQASELRSSLHEMPDVSSSVEPMLVDGDAMAPAMAAVSDLFAGQPSNNQLTHSAPQPDAMFSLLTRNDSLTSILLSNYSTVSSNSSIASVGVQVAALTKTASGRFMTASGTRFGRLESPTNQQQPAQDHGHQVDSGLTSLSPESLRFLDPLALGKSASSFALEPHESASPVKVGDNSDDSERHNLQLVTPQSDPQFSQG